MPKPKATPAQVREVLIAANCIRREGGVVVANASAAADWTSTSYTYWSDLMLAEDKPNRKVITVSKLREHAATLGLAPERIDQILPTNDGTT